ncbi:kinase-like domain-containing protein [Mucidula mucida]|nr:kinase-like domain-containing protein [Mucidula mucida]
MTLESPQAGKRASALFRTPSNKVFKLRVKLVLKSVNVHFTTKPNPTRNPPRTPSDVLADRYTLIRELGKGGFSTVWLARDATSSTDVAVKIPTKHTRTRELDKLKLLPPDGVPSQLTRLLDHFTFSPVHHPMTCLVLALHGPTIDTLKSHLATRRLPISLVKRLTVDVLTALEFMHGLGAGLAHTDIQPRNILLSRADAFDTPQDQWRFVLADLGHAVHLPHTAERPASPNIQPHALRAPEVILGVPWDCKVDIWNLGCLVYEFMVGGPLFDPFFTGQGYDGMTPALVHMLQIIEQVGNAPARLKCAKYFDDQGCLRCPFPLQRASLKAIVGLVWKDPEAVKEFVEFLRKMLSVDPELRWGAKRLVTHSWLSDDVCTI